MLRHLRGSFRSFDQSPNGRYTWLCVRSGHSSAACMTCIIEREQALSKTLHKGPALNLRCHGGMQVLHVIRHGESEYNAATSLGMDFSDPQIFNPKLTEKGRRQVCCPQACGACVCQSTFCAPKLLPPSRLLTSCAKLQPCLCCRLSVCGQSLRSLPNWMALCG